MDNELRIKNANRAMLRGALFFGIIFGSIFIVFYGFFIGFCGGVLAGCAGAAWSFRCEAIKKV